MMYSTQEASKNNPQLRIFKGLENALSDEVQVKLEEERKQLKDQKETEEFWAGRNLAGRNSTRWAA
jgi:hypothetical protein